MANQKIKYIIEVAFCHAGLAMATVVLVLMPFGLTLHGGIFSASRPGGFGHGFSGLAQLAFMSVGISITASFIATSVAVMASSLGLSGNVFNRFYRVWVTTMLFTNPVFLVMGFSTLFAHTNPYVAVVIATTYIILPLGAVIIQSGFDQFPRIQILAARSLGAKHITVLLSHIIPAVKGQIMLACFLMSIYALGFYLLPAYVGLGKIVTLGTAINTVANSVGDWQAAQQLACVMITLELFLLLIWGCRYLIVRSKR